MPTSASSGTAATARATARDPAFEQDLERSTERHLLELAPEHLDARQRIDQTQELETGVGLELGEHGANRLSPDQLIGHQHPRHAKAPADHQLLHRGDGDPPGAVAELAGEQLRRHGGLAVRAQPDVEMLEKASHPATVASERRAFEHRDRERQILAQQIPALAPDLAEGQCPGAGRPALGGGRHRSP
jgi:hypothetical protein